MQFELTAREIEVVMYALGSSPIQDSRAIYRKVLAQWDAQTSLVAPVVADAADDGPEVDLIRSFLIFPGGAFGGFGYIKQTLSDLWENRS